MSVINFMETMIMNKRIISVLLLLVMIFTLCSCGKTEKRTVTINASETALDCFLSVIIKHEGLFEKYVPKNVEVEWTGMTSGSEKRDALVSGSIDIGEIAVLNIATALQNNIPLVYLAYHGAGMFKIYARDPSIQSMEDIDAAHKVSVSSIGTGPHTAFLLAAQKDLGDTSRFDNSMITMSNTDAMQALISGTSGVDVVVSSFPTFLQADENVVHLVRDLEDVTVEYGVGDAYCTTPEFAEKNPDILDAFLKAYDEAVELLHTDEEECIKVMQEVYQDCEYEDCKMAVEYYRDSIDGGAGKYDQLMGFLYEKGILEQEPVKFDSISKYEAAK